MSKNPSSVLLFDFYSPLLSDRQREIFDCYYNCDLSLGEIAENYGITRQAVMNSVKKSENRLAEIESKLHMVEHIRSQLSAVEVIKKSASEILDGADVQKNARSILSAADNLFDFYS